jgi:predicted ArsR family transcriptional regulator
MTCWRTDQGAAIRPAGRAEAPGGDVELAERVGLHANGVRAHLERMERAGLVQRGSVGQGPGRPPDAWTLAPDAHPGGSPPRAYRTLARWLARAIGPGRGLRGIEQTGREIGRELAPEATSAPIEALQSTLSVLGFQPAARPGHRDNVTVCLGNCPYRDAVHENQPAIYTLHEGITRGLLEALAPDAKFAAFVPAIPTRPAARSRCEASRRRPTDDSRCKTPPERRWAPTPTATVRTSR